MHALLSRLTPVVAVCLCVSVSNALDEPPDGRVQLLMGVEHSGLSAMLVSPKDQRLAEALALIPTRLAELPGEFPDAKPDDVRALRLILQQLSRPMRGGVLYNLEHSEGGAWGYGAAASFLAASEADALAFETLARSALDQVGPQLPFPPAASDRVEGMADVLLPFGSLTFGPRKAADGWRYELLFGSIDRTDDVRFSLPANFLPGATPVLRGVLDFKALTPAANILQAAAGGNDPNVPILLGALADAGLFGPEAMRAEAAAGYTADGLAARAQVHKATRLRDKLGFPGGALTREDLRAVPADAGFALIGRFNFAVLDRLLGFLVEQNPETAGQLKQFNDWFGVDLRTDVLASLGGVGAAYFADSTAGGSPLGLVAMCTFADRDRFLRAHAGILAKLNELLTTVPPEAPGIGALARWEDDSLPGVSLYSLRVRGLPLPLELTYAATDRWLIAGLLPQAVLGAARQAVGRGDAGIAERPELAAHLSGDRPLAALGFIDAPRYLPKGFAYTCLLGSAIANGVRSRTQPAREPGLLVPPLAELRSGSRPMIAAASWQEQDLFIDATADRSMLVNAAAILGLANDLLPVAAFLGLTQNDNGQAGALEGGGALAGPADRR